MDPLSTTAVIGLLGVALQWAKAPQKVPTWVAYTVFGVASVVAFLYVTPGAEAMVVSDWRRALGLFLAFLLSVEGMSAVSRKIGVAPKTNSI